MHKVNLKAFRFVNSDQEQGTDCIVNFHELVYCQDALLPVENDHIQGFRKFIESCELLVDVKFISFRSA